MRKPQFLIQVKSLLIFVLLCQFSTVLPQWIPASDIIAEGIKLHDEEKYEEAIVEYQKVSYTDPAYGQALYETALSLIQLGKSQEALIKCEEALDIGYVNDPDFYNILATLEEELGDREKCLEIYEQALKRWPYNQGLLYNAGYSYMSAGNLELAESLFQKSLRINPYHQRSHLGLGYINYQYGYTSRAFEAYIMASIMNPTIATLLEYEKAVNGELDYLIKSKADDYGGETYAEYWENLDKYVESNLMYNESFPYKYSASFSILKKTVMLMDKVSFQANDTSFYNQYYQRFLVDLRNKGFQDRMIYYILRNTNNEEAKKWRSANEEKLTEFVNNATSVIGDLKKYAFDYKKESLGTTFYHFNDNNQLTSIGEINDNVKEGDFIVVNTDGSISEKGTYRNNEAQGSWNLYYNDGTLKQALNFVNDTMNGKIRTFYPNEAMEAVYNFRMGKIEGLLEKRNSAGDIYSSQEYISGLRQGEGVVFEYSDGYYEEQVYLNDTLDGPMEEYYFNGEKLLQAEYSKGALQGAYTSYYPKGEIKDLCTYENGISVGEWAWHYEDGTLGREGFYNERGELSGVLKSYNRSGNLIEIDSSYSDGMFTGIGTVFTEYGNVLSRIAMKEDTIVFIKCYDGDGREFFNSTIENGEIEYRSYYQNGQIESVGHIVNGDYVGEWRAYSPLGIVTMESQFKEGFRQGIQRSYYSSGDLKQEFSLDSSLYDGLYKEYYANGNFKAAGNYSKNAAVGEWQFFTEGGKLQQKVFYDHDRLAGRLVNYYPNGEIKNVGHYNDKGQEIRSQSYMKGLCQADNSYEYGRNEVKKYYSNGNLKIEKVVVDNRTDGDLISYYPDGTVKSRSHFNHGKRDGDYKSYSPFGLLTYEDQNYLGETYGTCKWYRNGVLTKDEHHLAGVEQGIAHYYTKAGDLYSVDYYVDGERHGDGKWYLPDGTEAIRLKYFEGTIIAYKPYGSNTYIEIDSSTTTISSRYADGKIAAQIELCNGVKNGVLQINFKSGEPFIRKQYKKGSLEGDAYFYFQSGKVLEYTSFKNGEYDGEYYLKAENGKYITHGQYENDERHGEWYYFNPKTSSEVSLNYYYGELYVK